MINTRHLLKLLAVFLAVDVILCPIVVFTGSGSSFLEFCAASAIGLIGFFLFFFMLCALFAAEFHLAFSHIAIIQIIGGFIGVVGCIIKIFTDSDTFYLIGFVVFVPFFTNAVIWEYFPKFYLKKE